MNWVQPWQEKQEKKNIAIVFTKTKCRHGVHEGPRCFRSWLCICKVHGSSLTGLITMSKTIKRIFQMVKVSTQTKRSTWFYCCECTALWLMRKNTIMEVQLSSRSMSLNTNRSTKCYIGLKTLTQHCGWPLWQFGTNWPLCICLSYNIYNVDLSYVPEGELTSQKIKCWKLERRQSITINSLKCMIRL